MIRIKKWLLLGSIFFLCFCLILPAKTEEDAPPFQIYHPPEAKVNKSELDLVPIYVVDLVPLNGVYSKEAKNLTENIKQALYDLNIFEVRELTNAGKTNWTEEKLTKCQEPACLGELGQFLKVEKVIQGKVGKFGRNYSFSLSVFDVQKNDFEKSLNKGCSCQEEKFASLLKQTLLELLDLSEKPLDASSKDSKSSPK